MSNLKQKNLIKRYKLRLQEQFKTVNDETEIAITSLNNCVLQFRNRVDQILEIKDDKFVLSYRKLMKDFDNFREKLIYIQSYLEEGSDEDSDNPNEVSVSQSHTDIESSELNPSVEHSISSDSCSSRNIVKNGETVHIKSEDFDKYGSVIEDDFCSLLSYGVAEDNAVNNLISKQENINNSENVKAKCESAQSISDSSCYQSFSSSINEAVALLTEVKTIHSSDIHIVNDKLQSTIESQFNAAIPSLVLQIPSTVSATLTYIVSPGDFWIQIENSSVKIMYSKLQYTHLSCPSTIKKFDYCLAPFKSSPFYYRAQSLQDAQHGSDVIPVHFIDHGSIQEVLLEDIRRMPFSAYNFPAQAIHCYLFDIMPIDGCWSDKFIERFKKFQNLSIHAVIKSKGNSYGVKLTANPPGDLNEDFSYDIASSLRFDELTISENEMHQDSTLDQRLGSSFNITQVSPPLMLSDNDSGVSLTSTYKSNGHTNDTSENLNNDLDEINLISFESCNSVHFQNSSVPLNADKTSCNLLCLTCKDSNYCLHLKIPSPTLVFVEKDMMIVMLSHIVSPHEFYVNMVMENIGNLDELREQMTVIYESQKQSIPQIHVEDLFENMFCAGYYDVDDHWYRVRITRINPQDRKEGKVLVQYIDYGNSAIIKCSDLLPLNPQFSQHPIFALKCSLGGILPIEENPMNSSSSEWNENAISAFKQLTSSDRCLTAQMCSDLSSNSDTYSVLLWDTKESDDLLINLALADLGVAKFNNKILLRTSVEEASKPLPTVSAEKAVKPNEDENILNEWDPMNEEFNDIQNSYGVDTDDIQVITNGYRCKDEEYVCKYFSLRGHCQRLNCRYLHVPLLEDGVTRDQEEIYYVENSIVIPEDTKILLLKVSAIINPSHFYAFLPFGCKSACEIDKLIRLGSTFEELLNNEAKALFDALNHRYTNAPFQDNTAVHLAPGTIVVAKQSWNQQFHRGRVIDVFDTHESIKIFFVDSGDTELVPRKHVRTILPQFLYTPFQAVQCSLVGVQPIGRQENKWSFNAVNFFKNAVEDEMLLAEIIHRCNDVLYVNLRRTKRDNHEKLSDLLVSEGFAVRSSELPVAVVKSRFVPG